MVRVLVGMVVAVFLSIIALSLATATTGTLTSQEILKMNMAGKTVYLVPDTVRRSGDNYTWTFTYVKPAMELKPVSGVGIGWVIDGNSAGLSLDNSSKTVTVYYNVTALFFVRKGDTTNYLLLDRGRAYNFTANASDTTGSIISHYFITNSFAYDMDTGKIYYGIYVYANDTIWRVSVYNATGKVAVRLTSVDGRKWSYVTPLKYGDKVRASTFVDFVDVYSSAGSNVVPFNHFYVVPWHPAYMSFVIDVYRGKYFGCIPITYRSNSIYYAPIFINDSYILNNFGMLLRISGGNISIVYGDPKWCGTWHLAGKTFRWVGVGGGVWVVGGRVFVSGVLAGVLNYYANGGWSGVYGHEFVTSVRDARVYHCLSIDHAVLVARVAKINDSAVNLTVYELPVIGNMTVNATLWKGVVVPVHDDAITLDLGKVKLVLPLSQDKVKPLLEKYGLLKYVTTTATPPNTNTATTTTTSTSTSTITMTGTATTSNVASTTTSVSTTTQTNTQTTPATGTITTSTPTHTTTQVTTPQTGIQTTASSSSTGFPLWLVGVIIVVVVGLIIAVFMRRK